MPSLHWTARNTVTVIGDEITFDDRPGLYWKLTLRRDGEPDKVIVRAAKRPLDEAARWLIKNRMNLDATLLLVSFLSYANHRAANVVLRAKVRDFATPDEIAEHNRRQIRLAEEAREYEDLMRENRSSLKVKPTERPWLGTFEDAWQ